MPDRPQSTPDPAAVPPIITPADFEDFAIFRETFLAVFTEPEHNRCLREVGNLIFDMALEYRGYWPNQPEGHIRSELRALVGDLRVIEGHLASIGNPEMTSPNTTHEEQHARVAASLSVEVRGIANVLESELGPWHGEAE
ncbi:MAG: hypothetical protein ABUT39_01480 [Acidobacteriota bacterium]